MSKINDGGPAFPVREPSGAHAIGLAAIEGITDTAERDRIYIEVTARAYSGMSLRDYFAANALMGMLANQHPYVQSDEHMFARDAYTLADAMLKARERQS